MTLRSISAPSGRASAALVPEAPLEATGAGLVPAGEGWFVLNAKDARWRDRQGRGKSLPFEAPLDFPQIGVALVVLGPGEPIGMYHWEADQEDFLVLAVGAREHQAGPDWGGYTVDETALRHGTGVAQETNNPEQAHARFTQSVPTRYRDGWLPAQREKRPPRPRIRRRERLA